MFQISVENLNKVLTVINDYPYKYAAPLIKVLQESLQQVPELEPTEQE